MTLRCFRGRVKARRNVCSVRHIRHKQRPPMGCLPMGPSCRTPPPPQRSVFLIRAHGLHLCQLGTAQKEVAIRGWRVWEPVGWRPLVLLPGVTLPQAVRTTAESQETQGVCLAHSCGRSRAAGVSFLCHRSRDLEKLVQETTFTSLAH